MDKLKKIIRKILHVLKIEHIEKSIVKAERYFIYKIITGRNWKYRIPFKTEIEWLKKQGGWHIFPYDFAKKTHIHMTDIGFDSERKLCYVNIKGKKLYWRRSDNRERILSDCNFLFIEQDEESPHRYFVDSFQPESNDIFVDIGCAEGKEALEIVDSVKEIYLFETEQEWIECLEATFTDYLDKVHIINAFVGNQTNKESNTLALDDVLKEDSSLLIKMDVEGAELSVLQGMENILGRKNVRLLVAAYHKNGDNKVLKNYLEAKGFSCEYSDHWMLPGWRAPSFFVRGIIRAWKQ